MPDRMPEGMPDRMPDRMSARMPEDMPDKVPECLPDRMPADLPDNMPEDMLDRMPDGMPEDLPDNMPEDMPDRMPDGMPEDMPEHMPEDMPEDMPEHLPEDMPGRMPEDMPDRMPDRMPENMSDRMPEDLPVTKCINVMVGITRSKVISSLFAEPSWGPIPVHPIWNAKERFWASDIRITARASDVLLRDFHDNSFFVHLRSTTGVCPPGLTWAWWIPVDFLTSACTISQFDNVPGLVIALAFPRWLPSMKVILLWYALQAAPFTEVRVSNAQRPTISFFKCQASEILVPVLLAPGGFGDWHALHYHLNFSY